MTQTHRGRAYGGVLYEENGYLYYRTDTGLVYALGIGAVAEVLGQVILFAAAGTTTFYDADDAGLTAALAAAVPHDIVAVLGSVTFSASHTIPDGVSLTSPTGGVVMAGAVTFGNDSGLVGISIQISGTGNLTSLIGPVSGTVGFARDCHLSVNSTDGGTALAASGLVYLYSCVLRVVSNGAAVVPVDATVQLMACDYSVPGGVTLYGDRADWIRLGKILLYKVSGAQMMVYEATSAGLAAALAAAVSGDVVVLPACSITGGPWTVPSGITLRGSGWNSILSGNITNNGTIIDCQVTGTITQGAAGAYCLRVLNTTGSGNGFVMSAGQLSGCTARITSSGYGYYVTGGGLLNCLSTDEGSGAGGIYCNGAQVVMIGCRFGGNNGGQVLDAYLITNCQFEGSGAYGFRHPSGTAKVQACSFCSYLGTGLVVDAGGLTVTDCHWNSISGEANLTYGEGDRVGGRGTQDVLPKWLSGGNNMQDSHLKDGITANYLLTILSALTADRNVTFPNESITVAGINIAQTWTADQTYQANIFGYAFKGIFDEPLSGSVEGEHFDNYGATYPPTWTEVDSAAITNTNRRRGFWQLIGTSANATWNYIKQLATVWDNAVDTYHSWTYGQIEMRDGRYTADLEYVFGVYANNAGVINTAIYNRVRIKWDTARGVWQARGEYSDGTTPGVGDWYIISWPIEKLQIRLMNNGYSTRRNMRAYIASNTNLRAQTLLTNKVWTTMPTMGTPWASLELSRGAGVDDYLFVGYVDYSTGDA